MKNILNNKMILLLTIILCVFMVGCGNAAGGGGTEDNKKYNEANYTLDMSATFEKELTLDEVKASLKQAVANFATTKSYSYTQKLTGEFDSQYTYEGVTKIDVTGATPLASIELTGTTTYAFYIANNKAYMNYNGYKTVTDVKADLSDIIDATQESIGAFVSFDSNQITSDNLVISGVDKDDVTVIKFNVNEEAEAMIVIHSEKIMKVLYRNSESMTYVANYDYNPVTITLPSDLDSYQN